MQQTKGMNPDKIKDLPKRFLKTKIFVIKIQF